MSTDPLVPVPALTVLIERDLGLLRAYVIQEGRKGSNLLPRPLKNVQTAKLQIQKVLNRDARQPVRIQWTGVQE
jgi:hypothetical protein